MTLYIKRTLLWAHSRGLAHFTQSTPSRLSDALRPLGLKPGWAGLLERLGSNRAAEIKSPIISLFHVSKPSYDLTEESIDLKYWSYALKFTAFCFSDSALSYCAKRKTKQRRLGFFQLTKWQRPGRIRSSLSLFSKVIRSDSVRFSAIHSSSAVVEEFCNGRRAKGGERTLEYFVCSINAVPMALFGGTGNYASALFLAAVKANSLEKVETELLDLVEASKRAPTFFQFMKDLAVPADIRVKAINDICAQAKYSETTKNFLVVLAENERLRYVDSIAERFVELTMAHKGEVKVIVTTVIPLPPEEEKDLKETLQDILGKGKKAKVEQKIDPSILGGLVVEFGQKVFDMSIKTRAQQMERFLREPANFGII
ncbi:hypothetical protein Pint_24015 [Pistacia integerrima]|uniref:Uncharacterized protein n=1 Tax=Pistacia integerrima TaxID=434235 RepID=A0ACC0YJ07_9ROSI|nr:hypothetical protein Pint_24015 [Pistacia integerrima]